MKEDIRERFQRDTAEHVTIILHDEGLYRHLQCRKPGTGMYWFEITTAPGSLTFQGDGDSYTFRRQRDMFAFFRIPDGRGGPNLSYWAEKLVSGGSARRHSEDRFWEIVAEHVTPEQLKAMCEMADCEYDCTCPENARALLADPETPDFKDDWEWDFTDYDWWFEWACHAILWTIGRYDQSRQAVAA